MKRITTFLFALILSVSAFAQLPAGSTAPNFTATDLDGNTWELYDVLAQGKTVILNFSATWAAPCWGYHNSNTLETFYQEHGPNGDNTAVVLWIEGDPVTNAACISGPAGCVGGTQGNWRAGKTHPFIDDASGDIAEDYQINYFPTIYMICSDKVLEEVGQVGLGALEAKYNDCPVVTASTLLTGSVVSDVNNNCLADAGETVLPNWTVIAEGQNGYSKSTVSKPNGIYRMWLDTAYSPYTLSFLPPISYWSVCPAPAPLAILPADTVVYDHAAEAFVDCPYLTAQIGTPFLRRCFDNTFYVDVCNDGAAVAEDAYVEVTLATPGFDPVTAASLPFTVIAPGVYRFDLGDMGLGECINFNLTAKVTCDTALIGQTLCFEAHAFPDTLCEGGATAWNGASVEVSATCTNGTPEFSIKNVGTAPMTETSHFIVIEDDVMRSEGNFQLAVGESLPIANLTGNGSTWRVEALQVPHHPVPGNPSSALEGCTTGSTFSTGFVLTYPIYNPGPAHDIECLEVIGSWDPNDKTGFPLGLTDQDLISKNTDLDYLIRFQNTGTDTAFTIVVRDTLSANLDWSSIRLGASSHPYEMSLERNLLVFTFENIRLVDSFANEPASHGFLRFKISQKKDLPDGTLIQNRAGIFFDFNPVVLTNTTLHRIGEVPHVVSAVGDIFSKKYQLKVSPNPLDGSLLLRTEVEMPAGAIWSLFDFTGKMIAAGEMNGSTAALGARLQTDGLYRIEFRTREGRRIGGATIKN